MKTTFFVPAFNGAAREMQQLSRSSYKQERRQAHQHKPSKHLNNPVMAALSSTNTHSHPACSMTHEEFVALLAGPVMLLILVHTLQEVEGMYKGKNTEAAFNQLESALKERQQHYEQEQNAKTAAAAATTFCKSPDTTPLAAPAEDTPTTTDTDERPSSSSLDAPPCNTTSSTPLPVATLEPVPADDTPTSVAETATTNEGEDTASASTTSSTASDVASTADTSTSLLVDTPTASGSTTVTTTTKAPPNKLKSPLKPYIIDVAATSCDDVGHHHERHPTSASPSFTTTASSSSPAAAQPRKATTRLQAVFVGLRSTCSSVRCQLASLWACVGQQPSVLYDEV